VRLLIVRVRDASNPTSADLIDPQPIDGDAPGRPARSALIDRGDRPRRQKQKQSLAREFLCRNDRAVGLEAAESLRTKNVAEESCAPLDDAKASRARGAEQRG